MVNPIAHNLAPGFYLLDHTTGTVTGGPYSSRNAACFHHNNEVKGTPYVVLEVIGDTVPWLGAAVGNVCVEGGEPGTFGPTHNRSTGGPTSPCYQDRVEDGDCDTEADASLNHVGNDFDPAPYIG